MNKKFIEMVSETLENTECSNQNLKQLLNRFSSFEVDMGLDYDSQAYDTSYSDENQIYLPINQAKVIQLTEGEKISYGMEELLLETIPPLEREFAFHEFVQSNFTPDEFYIVVLHSNQGLANESVQFVDVFNTKEAAQVKADEYDMIQGNTIQRTIDDFYESLDEHQSINPFSIDISVSHRNPIDKRHANIDVTFTDEFDPILKNALENYCNQSWGDSALDGSDFLEKYDALTDFVDTLKIRGVHAIEITYDADEWSVQTDLELANFECEATVTFETTANFPLLLKDVVQEIFSNFEIKAETDLLTFCDVDQTEIKQEKER
ncbi:MAG: hypothetical protein ACRDCC_08660 [Culicoidibacterales bacterium]